MSVLARNRRARYDFELFNRYVAGIVLLGGEVKSCREGHVGLSGGYVIIRDGQVLLVGVKISKYNYVSHR